MAKRLQRLMLLAALVFAGLWIFVFFAGRNPPAGLGVNNGGLAECPDNPNCVCTDCEGPGKMDPFQFEGDPGPAKDALKKALAQNGVALVEETDAYLRAVATTPIMRFHDDLEFLVDAPNHLIHFRSASRLGHSDLGKNRARVEKIRAAFSAALRKGQ